LLISRFLHWASATPYRCTQQAPNANSAASQPVTTKTSPTGGYDLCVNQVFIDDQGTSSNQHGRYGYPRRDAALRAVSTMQLSHVHTTVDLEQPRVGMPHTLNIGATSIKCGRVWKHSTWNATLRSSQLFNLGNTQQQSPLRNATTSEASSIECGRVLKM
jgi:hypothetical protein